MKGQALQVQYLLFDPEAPQDGALGRKHSQFFQVLKADLRTPQSGAEFFKRFMAKLGYEEGNRGKAAWAEIATETPAVVLKISPVAGTEYVRTDIVQLVEPEDENENVVQLREWLANNPF
jgi:hypothetical protein